MTGPLKNARHEKFAQELAKGNSQSAAYKLAGFKSVGNAAEAGAARLVRNVKVAARLEELTERRAEKVIEKAAVDAAWVLKKAVELHDAALAAEAFPAAKGALELIGKHVDVQAFKDNIQHSGSIEYRNMSDAEIAARIAAHEAERGASRPTTH